MSFIPDTKANLLEVITLSVSHNPSEIILICSRNISYYYQCWKQLCCL